VGLRSSKFNPKYQTSAVYRGRYPLSQKQSIQIEVFRILIFLHCHRRLWGGPFSGFCITICDYVDHYFEAFLEGLARSVFAAGIVDRHDHQLGSENQQTRSSAHLSVSFMHWYLQFVTLEKKKSALRSEIKVAIMVRKMGFFGLMVEAPNLASLWTPKNCWDSNASKWT